MLQNDAILFSDIEWTIENFSFWSYLIHGDKIVLPQHEVTVSGNMEPMLQLYPRGFSGVEDSLILRFCHEWFFDHLTISFISSDGSVIKTKSIFLNPMISGKDYCEGPEFNEIIARITEIESNLNDSLTLRFKKKCDYFLGRHVKVTLQALNVSIKINSNIFHEHKFKRSSWNTISQIQYPHEESCEEMLELQAFVDKSETGPLVKFGMVPVPRLVRSLVNISTFCQSDNEQVEKIEEFAQIINGDQPLASMKYFPIPKIGEPSLFIILHLTINSNKILKMYSEVRTYPYEVSTDLSNFHPIRRTPGSTVDVLARDWNNLGRNGDFADFRLLWGPDRFLVHKGILCAWSPVFNSMFNDKQGAESGQVVIKDMDSLTLVRFLVFLYTGQVYHLPCEGALRLYSAADKYEVLSLKEECLSVLMAGVSLSNICRIMSQAVRHQDPDLASVAREFVLNNRISGTKEWGVLVDDNQYLIVKTFQLLPEDTLTPISFTGD